MGYLQVLALGRERQGASLGTLQGLGKQSSETKTGGVLSDGIVRAAGWPAFSPPLLLTRSTQVPTSIVSPLCSR